MAIQIGKYKRPGIFVEEFDASIISSPTFTGTTNLVMGFSRKGPVNTPIQLNNTNDLDAIFGPLDRNLERKGSYFHRTISKMLESGPVFAVNLLLTNDELDTVEYKSISAASGYKNDVLRDGPYRRFFDTTGFWKRDPESFINLTKNNVGYSERAFSFTNLSDRSISVFVFKSQLLGFDRTLIEWYGSVEKMPTYVRPSEYASDYMVDVVVVAGDWSNYQTLAVDPRWSQYFSTSGLRKSQVRNFANDRNITLLSYYEGLSLIPYFRDSNGRNIFIENIINADTDRTGLFCAFNADLVEGDFSNGVIDILGNNIVHSLSEGGEVEEIDMLSYKDTIVESITYATTPLDKAGNVTGFGPDVRSMPQTDANRQAFYAEGYVDGVTKTTFTSATSSISVTYTAASGAYAVISNTKVDIDATAHSFTINSTSYPTNAATMSYASVFVVEQTGDVVKLDNLTNSDLPSVATTDIVLGYVTFDVVNGSILNVVMDDICVDTLGFKELTPTTDYVIDLPSTGAVRVTFVGTNATPQVNAYQQYRKFKLFNRLVSLLSSTNKDKMTLLLDVTLGTNKKASLSTMTVSNIVTTTLSDKSFTINTGLTNAELSWVAGGYGNFVIYTTDNEFVLGTDGVVTKDTQATATDGVVAKYSSFYTKFYDGIIGTDDYFYENLTSAAYDVEFYDHTNGDDYVVVYGGYNDLNSTVIANTTILSVPSSLLNKGSFLVTQVLTNTEALSLGLSTTNLVDIVFKVSEDVTPESLMDVTSILDYSNKHYLEAYLDNTNNLQVEFTTSIYLDTNNNPVVASNPIVDLTKNLTIRVVSQKSNFKQAVEIVEPVGYTPVPNKILVLGSRYGELKVGDFLEAYVDQSLLQAGEMPRKITRILSKRTYTGDATLLEITCDARIAVYNFNGDKQTNSYKTIDNYVDTYKSITMKGFRVRQDSMPDGTEERQNSILNLVQKGTSLFKALTNKDAIDFRYVIDSFGLGLTEKSKQQLVDLCGERLDCFGFISMPSMKSFKNSSSPSFVNSEGVLQIEYVSKGGDPESNPAFLYSFGEGRGVTTVGYFAPYVTVNDNGRPTDVPPAAYIATTYMKKINSNATTITPWTIAAGITNGRVTGIAGTEMDFSLEDIEWFNQAQMNPIVYKKNRGYMIETENTAQTLYKSSLSYIHSREVLIELERELTAMLLDFQWKFNTPEVRAEIKLRADTICEKYVNKNGLYNYFNKCDEENNTSEIIDNQIGVLDTYVEIIKGMGIIVNNITILRTGAIQAGGFIQS